MASLHVIYASTSGHTEYVVSVLRDVLKAKGAEVSLQRAESAQSADLSKGDVLLLACGTWNTGGSEGQLNPHMYMLLLDRAKDAQLKDRPVTFIALGDSRYYYTARATEHLMRFGREHGAKTIQPPLVLVDEPYGQEDKIKAWGEKLAQAMAASSVRS